MVLISFGSHLKFLLHTHTYSMVAYTFKVISNSYMYSFLADSMIAIVNHNQEQF